MCTGTHYKSVLATGTSSARELVREALERYALSPERAGQYVLCDVVGQAGDSGRQWQAEGFRVFGDNEKPLLIQELWKPREGLSRRFELRKRSEMEELAARDVDTVTAGEEGREEARGGRRSGKHRAGVLLRRPVGLCRGGAQDGLFSLLCGAVCRAPAGGHSALLTASCSAVGRFLLSVEDGRPGVWHACHWPQRGPCPVQAAHAVQKAPQCPRRRGNLRGKRTRRRWRKRVSGGAVYWGARRGSGGRAGSSAEPLPGAGALQALRDAALLTRRKEAHCLIIGKRHKTWVFFRRPQTLQRISGHVWLWWLHTSTCTGLTCGSEQRAFSGLRRLVTRFRGAAGSRGWSSDVLCASPGVANAHVLRFSSGAKPTLCLWGVKTRVWQAGA